MRVLRRFLIRLAASATRRGDEKRLREELEQHLALQTAENVRSGLSPVQARRQAVLKLGAVEVIKEHYRDEQGLPVLDNLLQDVRYTLRQLHKAPVFAAAAILTLGLGIGANAALFTVSRGARNCRTQHRTSTSDNAAHSELTERVKGAHPLANLFQLAKVRVTQEHLFELALKPRGRVSRADGG